MIGHIGDIIDIDSLSPTAKSLVGLLGHTGDIAKALQKKPSLIAGLADYQRWRDQLHRHEGAAIVANNGHASMAHELSVIVKKLSGRSRNRKIR